MKKIFNEFEIRVEKEKPKTKYKPLPTDNLRQQERIWEDKSNKELEKRGSNKRIYNRFWHNLLEVFFIITIIVGIIGFLWLASDGYFKTEVNQNVECPDIKIPDCNCPNISIPSCPDFNFNQTINKFYTNNNS